MNEIERQRLRDEISQKQFLLKSKTILNHENLLFTAPIVIFISLALSTINSITSYIAAAIFSAFAIYTFILLITEKCSPEQRKLRKEIDDLFEKLIESHKAIMN